MYGIDKNAHLSQIKELKIRETALKGCKGAHNRYFRWMNLFESESDTVKEEHLEQERILLSTPLVMEMTTLVETLLPTSIDHRSADEL